MPKLPTSKNITFSKSYVRRNEAREELQKSILEKIRNGSIVDDNGIQEFLSEIDFAVNALKSVPYEIFLKSGSSLK